MAYSLKSLLKSSTLIFFLVAFFFPFLSCNKSETEPSTGEFRLSSPAVSSDSSLPTKYTCDGESASLPLEWANAPENTHCFALLMQHFATATDIHWYWVLYNIPSSVTSLPENAINIGMQGTNSVNDHTEYAPPCSQGPGRKDYILTLYALSGNVLEGINPETVNRKVLLDSIRGSIIDSCSMTVWYSRNK